MVAEAALVLDRLESRKAARLKVPIDNGRNLELRRVLETLDSRTRDTLRRVLIHGRADRDAVFYIRRLERVPDRLFEGRSRSCT